MKKFWPLAGLLLSLLIFPAFAEVQVSVSPASVRAGDYVDVSVSASREGAQGVIYSLSAGGETIFKGELTDHWTAAFRPRTEADHVLTVTVVYGKKDTESASVTVPVSGAAPVQEGPDVVYQQKDGWWKNKKYAIRSVQKAGCALFTLSHALQRMGMTGEDLLPDALARTYKAFYVEGRGTANESFLRKAGETYGFSTLPDLITSPDTIVSCLKRGDFFSFMIVTGHIALADRISESGDMVHIVDSAAGATYERIKGESPWIQLEDGTFAAAKTPEEMPGLRWYFETGEYGGAEYWLPLSYCAGQGMRLIRPAWLTLSDGAEDPVPVSVDYFGSLIAKVILNGESVRVPVTQLQWNCIGSDQPLIALVTRNGDAQFSDGEPGLRRLEGYLRISFPEKRGAPPGRGNRFPHRADRRERQNHGGFHRPRPPGAEGQKQNHGRMEGRYAGRRGSGGKRLSAGRGQRTAGLDREKIFPGGRRGKQWADGRRKRINPSGRQPGNPWI